MIFLFTLLSFKDKEAKRIFAQLSPGKGAVTVGYEEAGGITAKRICCEVKRGGINSEKLIRKLGREREVVCDPKRKRLLPRGVRCFSDRALRERLCGNFSIAVAQRISRENPDVKIGLFDPDGGNSDLPVFLTENTKSLRVVSFATEAYEHCAEWLIREKGALFALSSNICDLEDCLFIIAIEPLRERIYPRKRAVMISSEAPSVPIQCESYWDYSVDVPERYKDLRPKDVPEITFCGALYEKCGMYELGSQTPLICRNGATSHTAASLGKYIAELSEAAYE